MTRRRASFHLLLLCLWLVSGFGPGQAAHARGVASDGRMQASPEIAAVIDRLTEVAGRPPVQTTRIYDRFGNLLYEIADEGRRTVITLDQVSPWLIDATIATEDKQFFKHSGVDMTAIARAAFQNWQADQIVSGASTITQQLARTLILGEERKYELSLRRKMDEALLAMDLESRYSKKEILEMYLNTIYYGHQAYGVEAAAQTYFRKSAAELTLAESALLAGIPQSPNDYDPFIAPQAAFQRQRVVLDLMERHGFISAKEKQDALAEKVRLIPPDPPVLRAPHFVNYVRELLYERYGPDGMRTGLQVHTTIDLRYQQLARQIARGQIARIGKRTGASNAAVVILHPPTGQILAMVGSLDYYDEAIDGQVNMTVQPRQPGSAVKPIIYAAALENGWTPATVLWDTPVRYRGANGAWYAPRNSTNRFFGPTRVRAALANSLNVPAIKLLDDLGVEKALDMAHRLGVRSWRDPVETYGLSLAVGGYELTLLELTQAFSVFANQGRFIPARPITEIRDAAGRVLFQAPAPTSPRQVVSPVTAYQLSSILSDADMRKPVFGPNSALNVSQPAAVKTGTTDDFRDNLTVGYTPYVAVGVWVGNSDGRPMRDTYGSQGAAPIWHDIMEAIWENPALHPTLGFVDEPLPQGFPRPEGVYVAAVCDLLPGRFRRTCPRGYNEVFALPDVAPRPAANANPRGYCLPALAKDLPPGIDREAFFIPLPRRESDRAAAQQWAKRFGLKLTTFDQCNPPVLSRKLTAQPPPPDPKRLIPLPEPAAQQVGLWPGARVVISEDVRSLNVRVKPDPQSPARGSLKPRRIAVIRQGPVETGDEEWYEIRAIDNGLHGWALGRYLRALQPDDLSGPGELIGLRIFAVGQRVRPKSGVTRLRLRPNAGLQYPSWYEVDADVGLIVTEGPRMVNGAAWYAVEWPDGNVRGWVDGRYLVEDGRSG